MDPIVLISIHGDSLTFDSIEAVAAHLNDPSVRNSKKSKATSLQTAKMHLEKRTHFKINGVFHALLYLSEIQGLS